jgi:hypothetical protein
MPDLFQLLNERAGQYAGEGMNHAGETFRGKLGLLPMQDGSILLRYIAVGLDGTLYHREQAVLMADGDGGMILTVESNDHPGPLEHGFRREEAADGSFKAFVFGHGETLDHESFREEIAIDIWSDGDIGYRHAWGLPGGEFASRSGARMQRVA